MPWLVQLIVTAVGFALRYLGALIWQAISSVWAWVLFWLPAIAVNLLKALGVGFVAYSLGDFGLDSLYNYVETELYGLPSMAMNFLKMSGVLQAISIIFGALSARITYVGLSNGRKTMSFLA